MVHASWSSHSPDQLVNLDSKKWYCIKIVSIAHDYKYIFVHSIKPSISLNIIVNKLFLPVLNSTCSCVRKPCAPRNSLTYCTGMCSIAAMPSSFWTVLGFAKSQAQRPDTNNRYAVQKQNWRMKLQAVQPKNCKHLSIHIEHIWTNHDLAINTF